MLRRACIGLAVLILVGCNLPGGELVGLGGEPTPQATLPLMQLPTPAPTGQATGMFSETPNVPKTPAVVTPTKAGPVLYTTQGGDTLPVLAVHFGVSMDEITSPDALPREGLLPANQLLMIPRALGATTPVTALLPDSEVVNSPSAVGFDVKGFVKKQGGYLSTYQEYLNERMYTGAELIELVARENSINPRLLLALLEVQANWITGRPADLAQTEYPLGYKDINYRQLAKQLVWAVQQIGTGYYGWRAGAITTLTFPDQSTLRLAPELNAGTVGLLYYFSRLYTQRDWGGLLYTPNGFAARYEKLLGSPWLRAQAVEPLFPTGLRQSDFSLPFQPGFVWAYTGGPHPAWATGSGLAAIDFAPGSDQSGCVKSEMFVLSMSSGLVLRAENGQVVVDLDSDGHEETGWVLLYMHVSKEMRVLAGAYVSKEDVIGHPSCEGGVSTGTHLHLARKYNGEWIAADGPLPFVLSGWRPRIGAKLYEGRLERDGKVITASQLGSAESRIIRSKGE